MNQGVVNKTVLVVMVIAITALFLSMIHHFLMAILLAGLFSAMARPDIPSFPGPVQGAPAPGFRDHDVADDRGGFDSTVAVGRYHCWAGDRCRPGGNTLDQAEPGTARQADGLPAGSAVLRKSRTLPRNHPGEGGATRRFGQ